MDVAYRLTVGTVYAPEHDLGDSCLQLSIDYNFTPEGTFFIHFKLLLLFVLRSWSVSNILAALSVKNCEVQL